MEAKLPQRRGGLTVSEISSSVVGLKEKSAASPSWNQAEILEPAGFWFESEAKPLLLQAHFN